MITRLYANNFRSLVAFEARFDSFGLLCGPNGAGKSSVFDALRVIRDLATDELETDDKRAIRYAEHTNWLDSKVVEFEVDIQADGRSFMYRLHIEQIAEAERPRVIFEEVTCHDMLVFKRDPTKGIAIQTVSSGSQEGFSLDERKVALGSIQAPDGSSLAVLQQELARVLIVRPNPLDMENESREESQRPDLHFRNLTSWFRHLSQEQEWSDHLRNAIQGVWPDFRSFRLVSTGLQAKRLQLRFDPNGSHEFGTLYIDQLSDGERMLVGLYMLQSALATGAAHTVLIDEPDNFVGLPELQPWVTSLMEVVGNDTQALVISHNPEILNLVGEQFGRYLWRDNHTSPTRIGPLRAVEGISVGEAVARGWAHA